MSPTEREKKAEWLKEQAKSAGHVYDLLCAALRAHRKDEDAPACDLLVRKATQRAQELATALKRAPVRE